MTITWVGPPCPPGAGGIGRAVLLRQGRRRVRNIATENQLSLVVLFHRSWPRPASCASTTRPPTASRPRCPPSCAAPRSALAAPPRPRTPSCGASLAGTRGLLVGAGGEGGGRCWADHTMLCVWVRRVCVGASLGCKVGCCWVVEAGSFVARGRGRARGTGGGTKPSGTQADTLADTHLDHTHPTPYFWRSKLAAEGAGQVFIIKPHLTPSPPYTTPPPCAASWRLRARGRCS